MSAPKREGQQHWQPSEQRASELPRAFVPAVVIRLPAARPELPFLPLEVWYCILAQLSRRQFP